MPVYTYHCEACGLTFDQRLRFNDPQPARCPECGAEALHRVYKPVGIVFKGSGFYATDHRSPSGTKNGQNGNGSAATSEKAETKTEAKPKTEAAAKTEAKAEAKTKPTPASSSATPAKAGKKA